ncbi:MAG: AAA family ATPase [Gemmataceae bacterium]
MSIPLPPLTTHLPPLTMLQGVFGHQLPAASASLSWLWHGFLAKGNLTLLTSQWKTGKTTLLALLLSRFKAGGQLAGLDVAPARPIVLSEESALHWRPRHDRLGLSHAFFVCRPFRAKPTFDQWTSLIDDVDRLRHDQGFDCLAIDPLASFLPTAESSADAALKALLPLQKLTDAGMAILITHHPRKAPANLGAAPRGSGAVPGFADITLEMSRCPGGNPDDRRRRLLAFSRFDPTPPHLLLELNPDATDYLQHEPPAMDDFHANWLPLQLTLEDATDKLNRRQILESWPDDFEKPHDKTLARWLDRATKLGLIALEGSGRRNNPFRYWLPYVQPTWHESNPDAGDLLDDLDAPTRAFLKAREECWRRLRPGRPIV